MAFKASALLLLPFHWSKQVRRYQWNRDLEFFHRETPIEKGCIGRESTVLKYNIIYYIMYRCLVLLVDKLKTIFLFACFVKV